MRGVAYGCVHRPALAAVLVSSLALGGGIVAWHRAGDPPAGAALGVEAPIPADSPLARPASFAPASSRCRCSASTSSRGGTRLQAVAAALTIATPSATSTAARNRRSRATPFAMAEGGRRRLPVDRSSLKADLAMTRLPAGLAETAASPSPMPEPKPGSGFQAADPFPAGRGRAAARPPVPPAFAAGSGIAPSRASSRRGSTPRCRRHRRTPALRRSRDRRRRRRRAGRS